MEDAHVIYAKSWSSTRHYGDKLADEKLRNELVDWCESVGQSKFRASQIRRWLFGKRVNSFTDMHDLPAAFRTA